MHCPTDRIACNPLARPRAWPGAASHRFHLAPSSPSSSGFAKFRCRPGGDSFVGRRRVAGRDARSRPV